jgi:hypothetical protein
VEGLRFQRKDVLWFLLTLLWGIKTTCVNFNI